MSALTDLSDLLGVEVLAVRRDPDPGRLAQPTLINGRWRKVALDVYGQPRRRGWSLSLRGADGEPARLYLHREDFRAVRLNEWTTRLGRCGHALTHDDGRRALRLLHEHTATSTEGVVARGDCQ